MRALFPALLLLAGCAAPRSPLGVQAREAVGIEARSSGPRWMAVSCVRAHLDAAPATTFLLAGPLQEQRPTWPGRSEGIIPAGTPVTLLDVVFPGERPLLERPVGTPRDEVWVKLQLPGGTVAILPLPDTARSEQDFWGALGQWVTRFDPGLQTASWNDAVVEAVRTRRLVVEMPDDAVLAAWGPPLRREVRFEAGARRESWVWSGPGRSAELLDGKLVEARAPDATGTVP
jgi:hypothetical protein